MEKKSDIVREAVQKEDWKKALRIAKDFRIGVTKEQRDKMARAYECIVHPDFYQQISIDISEAIEHGKAIVKEYAKSTRRKNTMMKWDVKHDRAKRVIDAFLENAGYWQEREDLVEGLTDEEIELVDTEISLMIKSIRKRYKLQVRLPEVKAEPKNDQEEPFDPLAYIHEEAANQINSVMEHTEETENKKAESKELTDSNEEKEKPKRGRKPSSSKKKAATSEKKATTRKPRAKKSEKEEA